MPEQPEYLFIPDHQGQDQTKRELQRAVRSHAAIVSQQDLGTRRRKRRVKLSKGEGVIAFDPEVPGAGQERTLNAPSNARTQITASTSGSSHSNFNPPADSRWFYLDSLSGQTFSPISHLPAYHKPYLPGIINHYISNLTIPTPELDGSSNVSHFRAAWVPVVIHDPVIFQVIVLFAATHYATCADPSQFQSFYAELLHLKQSALSALIQRVQIEQNAVPNLGPRRHQSDGCSDTMIAATAKMASYEAIFGTPEAFHVHMSTVARLLRMRGDVRTLGINGFLARLLAFIDINSAFLLGSNMYLTEFGLASIMPHHQPFPPTMLDEAMPPAQLNVNETDAVNLERFLGSMNV